MKFIQITLNLAMLRRWLELPSELFQRAVYEMKIFREFYAIYCWQMEIRFLTLVWEYLSHISDREIL